MSREDLDIAEATDRKLLLADVFERQRWVDLWPADDWKQLQPVRRAAAVREAAERKRICEVLTVLAQQDVSPLLLKGAALAYTVYPHPWLRPRTDLDILVRRGSMPAVAHAVAKIGFVGADEATHPLITSQRHFVDREMLPMALDVHETLVNPQILRTLPDYDQLVHRAQTVPALGPLARALSTHDALLHALVHRVAHHNSTVAPIWLYDMHLLAGRMTDDDWSALVASAQRTRVCAIVSDGLRLLVRTLYSAVPPHALRTLSAVRGEASAALIGGELTELRLQWLNFQSLDGVRSRLAFVRAHLAPPRAQVGATGIPGWRLPFRYAARATRGFAKWLQPIARRS